MQFDKTGLESYITDPTLESDKGVWLDFPGDRGFLVYRAGGSNEAYARKFQHLIKPYRRQLDKGTISKEVSDHILRQVYAETIIKDWRGIKDEQGQLVPFTTENCVEFLKAFPELFADIQSLAGELATFNRDNVEEAMEVVGEA